MAGVIKVMVWFHKLSFVLEFGSERNGTKKGEKGIEDFFPCFLGRERKVCKVAEV